MLPPLNLPSTPIDAKSMDPREGKYYANKTAEAIKTVLRILRESQGEHHHTAEGAGHE
jgi:hypothetical protein